MTNTSTPVAEKPWLWKKGTPSPNPSGRTKAHVAVQKLREAASEKITKLLFDTGALSLEEIESRSMNKSLPSDEVMVCKVRSLACEGDMHAVKLLWERLLGKPLQSIEVDGIEGLQNKTGFEDWTMQEMLKLLPKVQEALEKAVKAEAEKGRPEE